MIVGIGLDLVEVPRIHAIHTRHPDRFVKRILTEAERQYVLRHREPAERIAGRWVAKEAALKALGTGIADGIRWQDIEILPDQWGRPVLQFYGKAKQRAEQLGANVFHVTITHVRELAAGQVILERMAQ